MGFARVIWTITRRLLILSILILAFIGSALTAIYLSRGEEVAVPKLVGKNQNEAKRIGSSFGLQVESIEIFDEGSKKDIVVRQDPKAGMIVKKGFTVKVYYSSGNRQSESKNSSNLNQHFLGLVRTLHSFDLYSQVDSKQASLHKLEGEKEQR